MTIIKKSPHFFYSVRDFKSENKDNLNENSKSKIASIQKSPRKDYFGFIIMKIVRGRERGLYLQFLYIYINFNGMDIEYIFLVIPASPFYVKTAIYISIEIYKRH